MIDGYFGPEPGQLKLAPGDVPAEWRGGDVLEGKASVEEAQAIVVRRTWKPGESYTSVRGYDPVLRSHCRLDREG